MDADAAAPPGMPLWVKVFAIAVLVVVLAFVALHLLGGGAMRH